MATGEQNERRASLSERVSEFPQKLMSPKFLLMAGIAASAVLILEGFICFSVCLLNVRSYVLSFYYIVFGLISIAAELKFKIIYRNIQIIHSKAGRGFWYIFLGTLALGREWWGWLCALLLILLGILNVVVGCRERSDSKQANESVSDQDHNQQHKLSALQSIQLAKKAKSVSENIQPLAKAYDDPSENQYAAGPMQNAYDDY